MVVKSVYETMQNTFEKYFDNGHFCIQCSIRMENKFNSKNINVYNILYIYKGNCHRIHIILYAICILLKHKLFAHFIDDRYKIKFLLNNITINI